MWSSHTPRLNRVKAFKIKVRELKWGFKNVDMTSYACQIMKTSDMSAYTFALFEGEKFLSKIVSTGIVEGVDFSHEMSEPYKKEWI